MKILFLLFVCFAVAFANFEDIEALMERADTLVNWAEQLMAKHKGTSHGHLFNAVEAEILDLFTQVGAFKGLDKNKTERFRVNDLEERILYHSNRLSEELKMIEDIFKHHKTGNELIEYGDVLSKKAKEVIAKHKDNTSEDMDTLKNKLMDMDILIGQMKHYSTTNPTPITVEINGSRMVDYFRIIRESIRKIEHK